MQLEAYYQLAKEIMLSANSLLLERFQGAFTIESKLGNEIVTSVDKEVEDFIVARLKKETNFSILGEESGLSEGELAENVWILDPLDGTTNFSRGIPVFGTSLALMVNKEIVIGVMGDPTNKAIFSGMKGRGAFKNDQRISINSDPSRSPLIFLNNGYPDIAHERCKTLTNRISNNFDKRSFGTTVIEMALVAEGKVDAFVCSGDKIWDFAAGLIIAKEAGACVTTWDGKEWTYGRDDIICCRPDLKSELVSISKDLI